MKFKTRKSAAKRIHVSKRGKVKIARPFKGHLLTCKSRKRKRHLKQKGVLGAVNSAKLRQMLLK